jgi:hypothetical protein
VALFFFILCLLACVILRIVASKSSAGLSLRGVNWALVIVSSIAFFIWAHAVSTPGPVYAPLSGTAGAIVAMVYGVVAPKLVPAEPA